MDLDYFHQWPIEESRDSKNRCVHLRGMLRFIGHSNIHRDRLPAVTNSSGTTGQMRVKMGCFPFDVEFCNVLLRELGSFSTSTNFSICSIDFVCEPVHNQSISAHVLQFLNGAVGFEDEVVLLLATGDGVSGFSGSKGVNCNGRVAVLERVPSGISDNSARVSNSLGLYVGIDVYSQYRPNELIVV